MIIPDTEKAIKNEFKEATRHIMSSGPYRAPEDQADLWKELLYALSSIVGDPGEREWAIKISLIMRGKIDYRIYMPSHKRDENRS